MTQNHNSGARKEAIDLWLNILIVVTTAWAVLVYFIGEPDILGSHDVQCFKYFTTDSNILAALGSLLFLSFRLAKRRIPAWLTVFKFVGTVAASITLLTVVFFLAPMGAIRGRGLTTVLLFFKGNVFVLHLSTPLLAIVSTLFLERGESISKRQALWGTAPPLLYGMVYFVMVISGIWKDWYGFTFGSRYEFAPFMIAVMLAFSLSLSLTERRIRNCI